MGEGLRVCMVISQFHPRVGGAERQAQQLARKLIDRGISVTVITGAWGGWPGRDTVEGVPVRRLFCFWGIPRLKALVALSFMGSIGWHLLRQGSRYDLVHAHQILYPAFAAVWTARLLRLPALLKMSCAAPYSDLQFLRKTPGAPYMLAVLRKADRVVSLSRAMEEELIAQGFAPRRILRIPNGVDTTRFRPPSPAERAEARAMLGLGPASRLVLFAGRLDPQKDLGTLLHTWHGLARADDRLVLLGQGPQGSRLHRLAAELGILPVSAFPGLVQDIRPYLRAADAFVLPSLAEGLSNALLEAMATALPLVVSDIGVHQEVVIHEENGLRFRPGDRADLAANLRRLFQNPEWSRCLGGKARKTVEDHYSLDAVVLQYVESYQSLLSSERSKGRR